MLSDIEIAQKNVMEPISKIADKVGILPKELEQYGHYKGKISLDVLKRLENKPNGKLVLVTAITPTPAGEGKSTTSIGLAQALNRVGKKAVVALREPSLGLCSGSRAGLPAAVMPRWFPWMTSTSISPETCMPLLQPTTCCPL